MVVAEERAPKQVSTSRLMGGIFFSDLIRCCSQGLGTRIPQPNPNPLRQNFFRAGHAHAGVIVIVSLICEMLADSAMLPVFLLWFVRIGVPLAAILISAGFFFSVLPPTATQAGGAVSLIYVGAVVLAIAVISLGIGLVRA